MPKVKIRKSIVRRFKVTEKGKVLRGRAFRRHLKASKSKRRIRRLKQKRLLKGAFAKKIRKVVGK